MKFTKKFRALSPQKFFSLLRLQKLNKAILLFLYNRNMDTSFVEKKFIGFLVIWASSTLLVFAQAIGESVYQYMVLGSFLVFSGSEFADRFVITRKEVKK